MAKGKYPEIAKRYKTIREKQNCTQEELAKKLHISNTVISDLENGKKKPSITEMQAYCEKLKIPMEYLYGLSWSRTYQNTYISKVLKLNDEAIEMLKRSNKFDLKIANLINDLCSTEEGLKVLEAIASFLYDDYLYFESANGEKTDSINVKLGKGNYKNIDLFDLQEDLGVNQILFYLKCMKQNKNKLNLGI